MRSRKLIALGMLVATFTAANTSQAQHPQHQTHPVAVNGGFCQQFHYDYYRNVRWPAPFRMMDTNAVLSYFDVQRNNGWRLNNTVGASMFDATTNQLTDSGRAHVKWIVSSAPQNRRVVFVLQGDNQKQTAQRVEATQVAISQFIPVGPLPDIYLTDEDAPGSSGAYQTSIVRAMTTSVPAPRLPPSSGGGNTP